ncbi:MAG: phosphoribosylanthranilate isomerase [Candidatus Bathyarchaeota archaeon]
MKDEIALKTAVDCGADAVGFVVKSPRSPRNLSISEAKRLLDLVPPFVYTVAVTASASEKEILEISERLRPNAIQTYQISPLEFALNLFRSLRVKLIGALSVDVDADYSESMLRNLVAKASGMTDLVDAVLVDSSMGDMVGGTGMKGNWRVAREIRNEISPFPLILAGGLTLENISEAIMEVRPYAVDVSSGVESSPGIKDTSKIEAFIGKVRKFETND